MPESNAETQVRLHLETACSRALDTLVREQLLRCPVTLIAFDFGGGQGEPFSNVAFKTNLNPTELVGTVEGLLASWASGKPRVLDVRLAKLLRLPDGGGVIDCANALKRLLGSSVGFSLIFGVGEAASYVSNGAREDVAMMLRDDCLPRWRKDAGL